MTLHDMTKYLGSAAVAMTMLSAPASAANFSLFTDRTSFDAATGAGQVTEDFNGAQNFFSGDSTGNVIGTQTTMDVVGPGDSSPQGITGGGFLELDVDASGSDQAFYTFNTGNVFGIALDMIQDDNSTPNFDVTEVGIRIGGMSWLVSDILGLTDSTNGTSSFISINRGPVFVGITSDTAFDSFDIVHGSVVTSRVAVSFENVWIDNLVLDTTAPIPLPAGLPLMLAGLGAFGLLRRRS